MSVSPWATRWASALYGPTGFYRRNKGPGGHFATSAHGVEGREFAVAIGRLAKREGASRVVDLGAGRGEFLTHLAVLEPDLQVLGVDIVERPTGLPDRVQWIVAPGGAPLPEELASLTGVLVVANEWLDVVPCTIGECAPDGSWREVLVDDRGIESLGDPLDDDSHAWCALHWPLGTTPGQRVEVGLARDRAWADLLSRIDSGTALAIDYGHEGDDRPRHGTLTAYRDGAQVEVVPDGTCDLTAHVAVDSLTQHGRQRQRDALADLGVTGSLPEVTLARTNPAAYMRALESASAQAELRRPGGLGDFWWVTARAGG